MALAQEACARLCGLPSHAPPVRWGARYYYVCVDEYTRSCNTIIVDDVDDVLSLFGNTQRESCLLYCMPRKKHILQQQYMYYYSMYYVGSRSTSIRVVGTLTWR